MKKRRTFNAEFKSKFALEALREQQSVHDVAKRYQIHPLVNNNYTSPFGDNYILVNDNYSSPSGDN